MTYGMTETGFTLKRYQDIRADLDAALKTAFGEINTNDASVFGQVSAVFSKAMADVWELAEATYYSQYVPSAKGVALDYAVGLMGVSRLRATPSAAVVYVKGTNHTVIPIGFMANVKGTKDTFETLTAVEIDGGANMVKVDVVVNDVFPTVPTDVSYVTIIDAVGYSYVVPAGETKTRAEIAAGMAASIIDAPMAATYTPGAEFFTLESKTIGNTYPVQPGSPLLIGLDNLHTAVTMYGKKAGATPAVAGTLSEIVTPVSGITEITNPEDAALGRNTETDTALRLRYYNSLKIIGRVTVDGIRSALLQEVAGVTTCQIRENNTDAEVLGIPPHAFEAIVSGGLDQDIADKIWEVKPAGIATWGKDPSEGGKSMTVVDSMGEQHTIRFSRPITKYLWVRAFVTRYTEEALPSDWAQQAQAAIVNVSLTQDMGKDVLVQRYEGGVMLVQGIATCDVNVALMDNATDVPDSSDYHYTNVAVSANEIVVINNPATNISVSMT